MNEKWINSFLLLAQHVAGWSKDPSTKVGAIVVDDEYRILSVGYNGFPRKVEDSEERLCNRETKLKLVVHAEANAIAAAARTGTSLGGATLVVSSLYPCCACAGLIAQAGIIRVITPKIDNNRWKESNEAARLIFNEAGVEVVEV